MKSRGEHTEVCVGGVLSHPATLQQTPAMRNFTERRNFCPLKLLVGNARGRQLPRAFFINITSQQEETPENYNFSPAGLPPPQVLDGPAPFWHDPCVSQKYGFFWERRDKGRAGEQPRHRPQPPAPCSPSLLGAGRLLPRPLLGRIRQSTARPPASFEPLLAALWLDLVHREAPSLFQRLLQQQLGV